jgi:hypothetical protein
MSAANLGCTLVSVLPFLAFGLVMMVWGFDYLQDDRRLSRDGVVTQGRMVEQRISEDSEGVTRYYITYTFVADTEYQRQQAVDRDLYNRYEYGAPVDIVYLASDPMQSRINGTSSTEVILLAFGFCWTLVMLIILYFPLSNFRAERNLSKYGTTIEGEVIQAEAHTDSDGDYTVKVTYRYHSPHKNKTITRTHSFTHNAARNRPLPTAGQAISILYYRDNQQRLL